MYVLRLSDIDHFLAMYAVNPRFLRCRTANAAFVKNIWPMFERHGFTLLKGIVDRKLLLAVGQVNKFWIRQFCYNRANEETTQEPCCRRAAASPSRLFSLTRRLKYETLSLEMSPRPTADIARLIGVGRSTLERWIAERKVPTPKRIVVGARVSRIWTSQDIERLKRYKARFYRKGRGRKKKKA